MIKLIITSLILNCILINKCFANDTIKLVKPIALEKIGREYAPGYLLIDYKDFQLGYATNNGFFNHLSYPHDKFSQVYFRNCNFGVYETNGQIPPPARQSGFFVFDSCIMQQLPIVNISGNIRIFSSQLSVLTVDNTIDLNLDLTEDSSLSFLVFNKNRNMKFQMSNCSFKDSGEIRIFNTTFSQFAFGYDKRSGCNIFFQNDTINWFVGATIPENEPDNYQDWYKHENRFTFNNCYINGDFTFFEQIPSSILIFNKCTFGPNVYLGDMAVDKLIITNCQNITEQLTIGFRETKRQVDLGLINSNLDNIRFDFTGNIKLSFDSNHTKDVITNSYKSLLEKFDHEGKERSYKFVDLQYRKYKDNKVWHFLNSIWWYHGYMPGLVFIWTTGLLFIFFFFNLFYWAPMYETYKMFGAKEEDLHKQKTKKKRFYFTALLYTIFIFFSLRINFEKLELKRLGFVYFFLFQYLAGLWCLLFIIRFIFKL